MLFKRKPKEPDSDEVLILKFKRWMIQLRNINKVYILCVIGAFISPVAWFGNLYLGAYLIKKNPMLRWWLILPFSIITLETVTQFSLLYANTALDRAGMPNSNMFYIYLCTVYFFFLFSIISAKIHALPIRKIQQKVLNAMKDTNEEAEKPNLIDKASTATSNVFQKLKSIVKTGEV